MKEAMKKYFRLWRFGWVAVVAIFLCGFGLNLIGLFVKFIAPKKDAVHVFGLDLCNIYSGIAVFLLVGLPYLGWILELSAAHLERYRREENKKKVINNGLLS